MYLSTQGKGFYEVMEYHEGQSARAVIGRHKLVVGDIAALDGTTLVRVVGVARAHVRVKEVIE